MGLPKRRTSASKRDKRRAHDALKPKHSVTCPQCREPMRLHHVCASCGFYRSKDVLHLEA